MGPFRGKMPHNHEQHLQILKDLGLSKIRILTNNPKKLESFEHTWDLQVVEQVSIIVPPHEHRERDMVIHDCSRSFNADF